MPMSNYPQGFAAGLSVRGMPLLQTNPGNVWWVGNNTTLIPNATGGADGNPGTFYRPFATLAQALTRCQNGTGDIVFIKPGHAETISTATALILNKAGVAIIGLGVGSSRPNFTLAVANTANIPVTAANVSLQNIIFTANFLNIASFFTATGTATPTDFSIYNCEFRDTSSVLNALTIFTGNATANSADGFTFAGNRIWSSGTTAATTAFKINSAARRILIADNFYVGAVLNNTAALLAHGANVMTELFMQRNHVFRPNTDTATGGILITTSATTNTGIIEDNYVVAADVAASILVTVTSGYGFMQNFYNGDGTTLSGFLLPAAGSDA